MKTDYLDLYLIHWPVPFVPGDELAPTGADGKAAIDWDGPSIVDTWKELVRISKETKKVKAIGVSNYTVEHLEKIINATGVTPAVNQIESHPTLIQPELFKYCKDKNIVITAYSPLGNNTTGKPRAIDAPQVQELAKKLGKEPAQVLIAWAVKNGFTVIPKSVTPSRIAVSLIMEQVGQTLIPRATLNRSSSATKTLRPSTSGDLPTLPAPTPLSSTSPSGTLISLALRSRRAPRARSGRSYYSRV